ncbi:hypothetical protein WICMUC_004627 [Wickerhamomyces mucosus]|uniref:DNA-binding protein REB1 n=1 Tax=Wickerhamomyces mucosus TaxID=1378264 RepID=A0A9P8TA23_9ASCO|nr:hypothetical protein WICMUC_004627 [Wickerhamomyces mucosus]
MSNDYHEGAKALLGLKKKDDLKNKLNDHDSNGVEAAVLRYVGGTLDSHNNNNNNGSNNLRNKRKKSFNNEELNEFQHWNAFLETDQLQQHDDSIIGSSTTSIPTVSIPLTNTSKPNKSKKKRRTNTINTNIKTNNGIDGDNESNSLVDQRIDSGIDVDPEIAHLGDHEQLVRAAILDANQLAQEVNIQDYIQNPNDDNNNVDTGKYAQLDVNIIQAAALAAQQHQHQHQQQHPEPEPQQPQQEQQMTEQQQKHQQQPENNIQNNQTQPQTYEVSQPDIISQPIGQKDTNNKGAIHEGNNIKQNKSINDNISATTNSKSNQIDLQPLKARKATSSSSLSNPEINENVSLAENAADKAANLVSNKVQGKMFSKEETDAIDRFIVEFCKINGMTRRQICERVWANERKKDDFWELLNRVLPYRSRASIYKHVRRSYHIFDVRGKWTLEEDATLGRLANEKNGQWKEIGATMGRMPEDCRDRWRNYVKCGNNRASNKWSIEEENKLKQIISEIYNLSGQNSTINWTVVSEKMGGTRSRIQCRYKWNKILKRDATERAQTIDINDRIWLLTKLKESQYLSEGEFDWNAISLSHSKGYWQGEDFKICYEKMKSSVRDFKKKSTKDIIESLLNELMQDANKNNVPIDLPVVLQQFDHLTHHPQQQPPHQQVQQLGQHQQNNVDNLNKKTGLDQDIQTVTNIANAAVINNETTDSSNKISDTATDNTNNINENNNSNGDTNNNVNTGSYELWSK